MLNSVIKRGGGAGLPYTHLVYLIIIQIIYIALFAAASQRLQYLRTERENKIQANFNIKKNTILGKKKGF